MTSPSPRITLFRGWDTPSRHVWSPFVIKLELRLRLAGISTYLVRAGSPRTAPRGKIPYITLSTSSQDGTSEGQDAETENGNGGKEEEEESLSDSTLIISELCERGVLPALNDCLDPTARAQDLAIRAMMEEKLYFYHSYERWILNYYPMREHVFAAMPYPLRILIGTIAHRKAVAALHGQGTGRLGYAEISRFRREIWDAIGALLSASRIIRKSTQDDDDDNDGNVMPFWVLGGEAPTEADAVVFGFIASVLLCDAAPDSRKVLKEIPILEEYASAIHDVYFPDYEKWPAS